MFTITEAGSNLKGPDIRIFGIGGAGHYMMTKLSKKTTTYQCYAVDSNIENISENPGYIPINIGKRSQRKLGAGCDSELGYKLANESYSELEEAMHGAQLIILIAGLGGGIGSGTTSIMAQIASKLELRTIICASEPFHFEGGRKRKNCDKALKYISSCDTALMRISNDKLLANTDKNIPFIEAMEKSASLICTCVEHIIGICDTSSLINTDFSDIQYLFSHPGNAYFAFSDTYDLSEQSKAIEQCSRNNLLTISEPNNAKCILIHVESGDDFTLSTLAEIGDWLQSGLNIDEEVIMGFRTSESLAGKIRMSLIATAVPSATALHQTTSTSIISINQNGKIL